MKTNDIETREFWDIKPKQNTSESDGILTIKYLMQLHNINIYEAIDLLNFCKDHTIWYIGCYGDGSIMYPKWIGYCKTKTKTIIKKNGTV